jgi:hypothetical protein
MHDLYLGYYLRNILVSLTPVLLGHSCRTVLWLFDARAKTDKGCQGLLSLFENNRERTVPDVLDVATNKSFKVSVGLGGTTHTNLYGVLRPTQVVLA